jgi:hypothetical protein
MQVLRQMKRRKRQGNKNEGFADRQVNLKCRLDALSENILRGFLDYGLWIL